MEDNIALITGANRGIGFEVAKQLAERGMTVIIGARTEDKATDAAKQLTDQGLNAVGKVVDVTDQATIDQLVADVEAEYGRLDVLVNNAAGFVAWGEKTSEADLDNAHLLMEINLFGAWRMAKAFLPLLMKSDRPRLVNVGSGAGTHGDTMFGLPGSMTPASYGISKAALLALTAKLAAEFADTKLKVNAAGPGLTATAPGMEEMGARPIGEGAASIVWAATLPDDGPTGGFFRDGEPVPW